jgi:hypothetical protein
MLVDDRAFVDRVDDFHSLGHTPKSSEFAVEIGRDRHEYKEMGRCRMRLIGARHRQNTAIVRYFVRLIGDRLSRAHRDSGRPHFTRCEIAALDDKVGNDPTKGRGVVKTERCEVEKIADRFGRLLGIELDFDTAGLGLEPNTLAGERFHIRIIERFGFCGLAFVFLGSSCAKNAALSAPVQTAALIKLRHIAD